MQSEIKKKTQGTNSEGKETGTQINHLEQKEEISIQPVQNEETRIQKMTRGLGTSGTTLNIPTSESQGCQKEKRKNKKLKTFEKIMENFSNLAKEIDFQAVQEAQEVPKKLDPRMNTRRHIIITLPKIKDKERIKSSKRKGDSYLQKTSHTTSS